METSSSMRMLSHKFVIEQATQEQWRRCNRERVSSKPKKSRRQLFRDISHKSKDRNDSVRPARRPSDSGNARKRSADLRPIDTILGFFKRELCREIDVIGVERPDGTIELVQNLEGFSQKYVDSAIGARSLEEIMADGEPQIVSIEYKLVPVIERVSIRERHHAKGECTVFTRKKSNGQDLGHDNYDSLAKLLDESLSMGYASQSDATALSTSNDLSLSMGNNFIPIGSSTFSTEASDSAQPNANIFDMVDMNSSLNVSQSSIYYECEASPNADTTSTIDRSHRM